ncbi:DUF1127 domain-containing protein [Aquabacter spiritensis]|uniref:Uncharacterized protein DUF1127 n=1 Tax=Aquabacter spiritensis TaxID=933073 RepID=A0A4R3LXU1_9HYPH|nr:DUF1127 domain-containing protein [Aquabacter spiritensis]TCT03467.1 uncharacterized protein DUF1127 [Aquabacter spiritensis]
MSVYGEIRTAATAPVGTSLAALLLAAAGFVVKVARAIERRHALNQLGALDDHMLRDIGLTRCDVSDAAAEPLWRDATQVLVMRAVERRAAAQLAARARGRD